MKDAVCSGLYLDSNKRKCFNEVKHKLATMLSQKLEENSMYTLVHGFLKIVHNEMHFFWGKFLP